MTAPGADYKLHSYINTVFDDNSLGLFVNLAVHVPNHSEAGNTVSGELGIGEYGDKDLTKLLCGKIGNIKSAVLCCVELKSCLDSVSTVISV